MSSFDKTGPFGTGAVGRGQGECSEQERDNAQSNLEKMPLRGRGRRNGGMRRGRGVCQSAQGAGRGYRCGRGA